jgi:transposase
LIRLIDARLVPDELEEITPGEAVAGMMLHSVGFSDRPRTLPPQFFANKPLDLLFREGVEAEMCNRFKRGRTREEGSTYGCDGLLSELALAVCRQEGMDGRFNHLDTTRFSLSGDSVPEPGVEAMHITPGSSKDHRPDLQQAIFALMVSQDGGGPFVSQSWDGKTSETPIVQERAQALITTLKHSPRPRYLVADSQLYAKDHAANLKAFGFITRIPSTLKLVQQVLWQALQWDQWRRWDATTRYRSVEVCHYGMAQRWLVGYAEAALTRAEATVTNAQQRESAAIAQPRLHVHARRFETPEKAHAALAALAQRWRSHQLETATLIDHNHSARKGRPTAQTPSQAIDWQIRAHVRPDVEPIEAAKRSHACFVLGTNISPLEVSNLDVITGYKGQAQVEGGFRFLKDPRFFVSSLLVKKPCRLHGLLMVMTFALLVYAVAQRRMRQQ